MAEVKFPAPHDVWLDNGVVTLGRILREADDDNFSIEIGKEGMTITGSNFDKLTEAVGIAIKNSRSNLIVIEKDKKLGTMKEVKKDYILIQEGKKIKGKVAFKEEIYNEKATVKFVKDVLDLAVKTGDRKCVLCGGTFSKPIKKLQQAAYPFVTKIRSLSGVRSYKDGESYSFKEYFEDFCPKCYFVGIIEWLDDAIIYKTIPKKKGGKSLLFLPHSNDLCQLSQFKDSYRKLLNKNSRWCNIRVGIGDEKTENTYGSFSTLLCFYEKFFAWADKKEAAGKEWVQIEIPSGTVKNIKRRTINLSESILGVIQELSEKKVSPYKGIISGISFYSKGDSVDWDLTHKIQEDISKALLEDDFHSFADGLLPRKGGHMGCSKDTKENLEDLIYVWRLKNMGIPKERLDTIKSVGNIVAKASRTNPSLLFKLDKARTTIDFWSVLREISRKLIGFEENDRKMIKPTALDGLIQLVKENETDWKEIRDLLVIYSSMYYSIGERKEGVVNE